jgi:hypothetical protein
MGRKEERKKVVVTGRKRGPRGPKKAKAQVNEAMELMFAHQQEKIFAQAKLLRSLVVYARDIDGKIDALLKTLTAQGAISKEAFEAAWDAEQGLVLKTSEIEAGDIAWVTARAGEIVEANIPVRIGAGAYIFESALIGKTAGWTGQHEVDVPADAPATDLAGKKVVFELEIHKVKTPLKAVTDEVQP